MSQGNIHPALQWLLRDGGVTCDEAIENDRLKKRSTITAAGREKILAWLGSPLAVSKVEDEVVLRLFCLGSLESERRLEVLDVYLGEVRAQRAELHQSREEIEASARKVSTKQRDVAAFPMQSLQFGEGYHRFVEEWLGRLRDPMARRHE